MRNKLILAFCLFSVISLSQTRSLSNTQTEKDLAGPIGLGLIVGSPTGISAKAWLTEKNALDAAFAWSFTQGGSFHIHADYLWHLKGLFVVDKQPLDLYFGIGSRILTSGLDKDKNTRDFRFGPRVPVGMLHRFAKAPIDIFLEFALIVDLVPGSYLDANIGLGARYFF